MATRIKKRVYGTGSIQQRGSRGVWHVLYYDAAGIRRSESAKTTDENKALRFLQRRVGESAAGINQEPRKNLKRMADTYFRHLRVITDNIDLNLPAPTQEWRRAAKEKEYQLQKQRWETHLKDFFAGARKILPEMLDEYVTAHRADKTRIKKRTKDSTLQRELALLRRILMYNRAKDIPAFPKLSEGIPRQGFVEDDDFENLKKHLPLELRVMASLAHKFGFRRGELQNMLCQQVNLKERTAHLFGGTTKNKQPRTIVLDDASVTELKDLVAGKFPAAHVFCRNGARIKKQNGGTPIRDFRRTWELACKAAKIPELLFHDLRRSGVRNMVRKGVPELVARQISGHLTPDVFSRYNITSRQDLADAASKIGSKLVANQAGSSVSH